MYIDLGNTGNNINFGSTGGGDCNIEPRTEYTITKNGSYPINPDDDYDAMEGVDVIVSVPEMKLKDVQSASYTSNGSYNVLPDEGYDRMSKVTVDVNVPLPNVQGTKDFKKNITMDGMYVISPDSGYDAMEKGHRHLDRSEDAGHKAGDA